MNILHLPDGTAQVFDPDNITPADLARWTGVAASKWITTEEADALLRDSVTSVEGSTDVA